MTLTDDCRELIHPWLTQPRRQATTELYALIRTFRPVPQNNDARKHLSTILVATWSVLTLGLAGGWFGNPSVVFYGPLTALVFLIVGRMWGLEVQGLAGPLQIGTQDDDE